MYANYLNSLHGPKNIDFSGGQIFRTLQKEVQKTLRVVHSPVVEKLPVVDKTLPPDHFYLAKAPSSGQFPVVDKKFWDTACKTLKSQHFFEIFWTFSCKEQNIL